ncbi:hypothetical protein C0Z01_14200 [Photobacterium kishitanii]|uniref:hypothetical protein n=1 Tax=Photobacterium kishitanii TaxID=318456 RepID=UPI0007EF2702|nr:hypothetical protein [Photobacterium kishitanii]OBU24962.1 hypothetical protein AYY22_21045 [Photobacterium kishitanii]PSW68708.1 hypothetical protein C0Z01_14200 [Photobacterium kishitanii]
MNAIDDCPALNRFDEILNKNVEPMTFKGNVKQRELGLSKVAELKRRISVFNNKKKEQENNKKKNSLVTRIGVLR